MLVTQLDEMDNYYWFIRSVRCKYFTRSTYNVALRTQAKGMEISESHAGTILMHMYEPFSCQRNIQRTFVYKSAASAMIYLYITNLEKKTKKKQEA